MGISLNSIDAKFNATAHKIFEPSNGAHIYNNNTSIQLFIIIIIIIISINIKAKEARNYILLQFIKSLKSSTLWQDSIPYIPANF
jgi:hypothetical protein